MPVDPTTDEQAALATPTAKQSDSFARYVEIGRHALRLERPPQLRRLREIVAELKTLIIYEHWLATGQNATRTAADLGIHRRSVGTAIQARFRAPDGEGET
jgi:hypothetical protein